MKRIIAGLIALGLIAVIVTTSGCAAPAPAVDFDRVCGLQMLGQRDGLAFARVICASAEASAEAAK
jgi:hypothetical protein